MDAKFRQRLQVEFKLRERIIKRYAKRWLKNGMAEFSQDDGAYRITDFGASVYERMQWKN